MRNDLDTVQARRDTPATVEEVVNRLIADPDYRIQVAVENNPVGALHRYQLMYGDEDGLSAKTLTKRLQYMWGGGSEQQVNQLLNIQYLVGHDRTMDGAFDELRDLVDANMSAIAKNDVPTGLDAWGSGLFGAIGLLANAATYIGAGRRAREAAAAEQARIAAEIEAQRQRDAARMDRLKHTAKVIGIGAAALGALVLLVWLIRK